MTQFFEQVAIDESPARILMVDDDKNLLKMVQRALSGDAQISTESNALTALERMDFNLDLVITDLWMPDMNGIQFIDKIRERNPDLPVVVISGQVVEPREDDERRIFKYLSKPFSNDALRDVVKRAVAYHRANSVRKRCEDLILRQMNNERGRYTMSETSRALDMITPFFQPIVSVQEKSVVGYEGLIRSKHPVINTAPALFEAARKYHMVEKLSRTMFERASRHFVSESNDPESLLFLNLAKEDLRYLHKLVDDAVLGTLRSEKRICLELTEEARMTNNIANALNTLRKQGFRLALDDVGAGYAGLNSLALFEPNVLKIDMALIRDVDKSRPKQRLVEALIGVANALHIQAVGEGVETKAESEMLSKLGCDWQQGYYWARPSPKLNIDVKFD